MFCLFKIIWEDITVRYHFKIYLRCTLSLFHEADKAWECVSIAEQHLCEVELWEEVVTTGISVSKNFQERKKVHDFIWFLGIQPLQSLTDFKEHCSTWILPKSLSQQPGWQKSWRRSGTNTKERKVEKGTMKGCRTAVLPISLTSEDLINELWSFSFA